MWYPGCLRLLIVDDFEIVRNGLKVMLAQCADIEIVGEADTGENAVTAAARLQPDVVLIDSSLPVMDVITAIQSIRQVQPQTSIVVLLCPFEFHLLRAILQSDVVGCLLKSVSNEELTQAIRRVGTGRPAFAPEIVQFMLRDGRTHPLDELTEREREILRLVARGLTNRQIAERLEVSPFTVKNHISNLLSKLGVSSRTEAATYALQNQLVQMDYGA